MNRKLNIFPIILCLMTLVAVACNDENNTAIEGASNTSWLKGEQVMVSDLQETRLNFTAAAPWTISSADSWCSVSPASGDKGTHVITLKANSPTDFARTTTLTLEFGNDYAVTQIKVKQTPDGETEPEGDVAENVKVNKWMHKYLQSMYLWNDEYKEKNASPDFEQNYQSFLFNNLMRLSTNSMDKKDYGNGYELFSFIEKLPIISGTRGTYLIEKDYTYSFGITGILPMLETIEGSKGYVTFWIEGVYENSPAAEAGLKRGHIITHINGERMWVAVDGNGYIDDSQGTALNEVYNLIAPNAPMSRQCKVEKRSYAEGSTTSMTCSLSSRPIHTNPVLFHNTISVGGHKIGYLVYNSFHGGYDQELFDALKDLKREGITDLILDLRSNGGGHTLSAQLLSTCIAGNHAEGKVFEKLRYNNDRMTELGKDYISEYFATSTYENLKTSLKEGYLNLNKLYVIANEQSASSSELVINSLRGIDIEVVLIGKTTAGKNVGMEPTDMKIGAYEYIFYPITFQTYNAKTESNYDNGFTPDIEMDEIFPYPNTNLTIVFRPWGSIDLENRNWLLNEPLYTRAVEAITGESFGKPDQSTRATDKDMRYRPMQPRKRVGANSRLNGIIRITPKE